MLTPDGQLGLSMKAMFPQCLSGLSLGDLLPHAKDFLVRLTDDSIFAVTVDGNGLSHQCMSPAMD